jgi:hypothetical protein
MSSRKVLITGMTAQQYSSAAAEKSTAFSIVLKNIVESSGYDVHFTSPSVEWTSFFLSDYSHIFVGLSSPASVTANATYGALSVVDEMWDSSKMTMFIDAPEPWKIFGGLRSIERTPDSLFKSFYSRRPAYHAMQQSKKQRAKVLSGIEKLSSKKWNRAIYPSLPWKTEIPGISDNAKDSLVPLSVDSFCISKEQRYNSTRISRWVVENASSKWATDISKGLLFDCISLKEIKAKNAAETEQAMSENAGVLLGPSDDKTTWWSARFSQAMNSGTPVATDWRASSSIGNSWSHLAATIESMSHIDRYELAVVQRNDYINAINSPDEVIARLKEVTGI